MLLPIIAVIIAVVGVVQLLEGQLIFGIVLLVIAAAVGPGGYSVFNSRRT
jgi:drug/metabolite transporter (DMT)-like permease